LLAEKLLLEEESPPHFRGFVEVSLGFAHIARRLAQPSRSAGRLDPFRHLLQVATFVPT